MNKIKIPEEGNTFSEGTVKRIFPSYILFEPQTIFSLETTKGEHLADIIWDTYYAGVPIFQTAIDISMQSPKTVAFDGKVNYLNGSDDICFPKDGTIYHPETSICFFNDTNPAIPNPDYELLSNNHSIRMNNISIFSPDFSSGCMLDFRASFEGSYTSGNNIHGSLVVLASILPIEAH